MPCGIKQILILALGYKAVVSGACISENTHEASLYFSASSFTQFSEDQEQVFFVF